jgi:drug/metabolite transporter (DMT)-like permease
VFISLILATQEVSVLALVFWRALMTFLVLVIGLGLLRPDWLQVRRSDLVWFGVLGGSISVTQLLWSVAVLLNGPAVATVQQAAMPAIVAVAAWLIWREPLTGRKILAILMTVVGTAFVSGVSVLGQADLGLPGLLAGLGLAVFYAGWNLIVKKVRRGYNPFTTLTYQFGFGALVLLPFQFFTRHPQALSAPVLLQFAGLVGVATVGGFSIYTYGVGRLETSVATILAMAEIPIVAVYTIVLLGERMTVDQILGAVLVATGVLILSWRREG